MESSIAGCALHVDAEGRAAVCSQNCRHFLQKSFTHERQWTISRMRSVGDAHIRMERSTDERIYSNSCSLLTGILTRTHTAWWKALGQVLGTATCYSLDGPGFENWWWARFSLPLYTVPKNPTILMLNVTGYISCWYNCQGVTHPQSRPEVNEEVL